MFSLCFSTGDWGIVGEMWLVALAVWEKVKKACCKLNVEVLKYRKHIRNICVQTCSNVHRVELP